MTVTARTIVAADRVFTGHEDIADAAVVIEAERIVDVVPRATVTPDLTVSPARRASR